MEDTRVLVEEESTSKPSEQEISPQKIDQKIQEKISSPTETDHQGPKPKKETKKGKKKTKSEKTSSADHGENEDDDDKADMGDMGTLFILDLMRQKREKLMRQKKDEKINEMAMKKKQQMMEARMGKRVLTRPSFGGFVGVNAILAGSKQTSPATRRRTPKPRDLEPDVNIPPPEQAEMLIMGILRDKKEQKFHEAHQVFGEQAGVPSDDKWMAKFED